MSDPDDGYLLPAVIDPPRICVKLHIPNELNHRAAFEGQMVALTRWYNWKRDHDHKAKPVADVWLDVFNHMVIDCTDDIYQIDPDNGCIIQVSHDNGVTWNTFLDVSACIPAPPDVSHFLVDNPGVVRENVVNPASGHFGILIVANNQVGLGVDGVQAFPAADFYQAGTADAAYPPLRLGRAAGGRGYIELVKGVIRRDAISYDHLFRAPLLSGISLNAQNEGGIYVNSGSNRGFIILPDGSGGWRQQRLGSGDGSGDGSLNTITGDYALLADGDTPIVTVSGAGDTRNIEVAFPHIPLPTVYSGEYDLLSAGDTPIIEVDTSIVDLSTSVVIKGKFPPIPVPTDFSVDNVEDDTVSQPTLDLSVVGTGSLTNVTYKLKSPPAFDSALPTSGTKHFSGIEIDAFGATLPFMIPSGYSIDSFTTRGLWYFQRFLEAGSKFSNGVHEIGHDWPYYTDLVAQATTGAADGDGFYAGESALFDIISDGFLASEDCFLKLEQSFQFTDGERKGTLFVDFDITAPSGPTFDWSRTFSGAVDQSSYWKNVQANGNPPLYQAGGPYWTSGVSGWILRLKTLIHRTAACTIQRVQISSFTQFPGSVAPPLGNRAIMTFATSGAFDVSDQAPIAAGSGTSTFDGLAGVVDGGDSIIEIDSVSYDHEGEITNDQEQRIISITIAGSGTEPMFSTF